MTLALRLGLRDQARRPVLLGFLVVLPFFFITRAIASTEPVPRTIRLLGDSVFQTTMREVHGSLMAVLTVAFLSGLCGVFVILAALQVDRRLVVAGLGVGRTISARLAVLAVAVLIIGGVSLLVTAISFGPESWFWFGLGTLSAGAIFGSLGVVAGATVGRLGATYLMLFAAMIDVGVLQNPMFGDGEPAAWARILPAWGPVQIATDGALAPSFGSWAALLATGAWATLFLVAMVTLLRRSLGVSS